MRKCSLAAMSAAVLFTASVVVSQAATLATSGYMAQLDTVKNTGASLTSSTKIYWKKDNLRIEKYTIDGTSIQIKNGKDFYVYVPSAKTAQKVEIPANQKVSVEDMFKSKMALAKGGKKIGTALVAGVKCNVFSLPAKAGSAKVYVSTDPRFPIPLKLESASGSLLEVSDTTVLKLNTSISDTMFTLPKGTKIVTQSPNAANKAPVQQRKKH